MWVLGAACLAALAGICAFHMVRPNFQTLRISVAHLLPDPPESAAPRRRFSLTALIASPRFWWRLLCVGLVLLAIWPLMLDDPAVRSDRLHYRIVLDASGSMAVADGGGSRLDAARTQARDALDRIDDGSRRAGVQPCIDLVLVGAVSTVVPAPRVAAALGSAEPAPQGRSAQSLIEALTATAPDTCGAQPTHAIVLTDHPARPVPDATFGGHLIWQQVGEPAANLALRDVRVSIGALRNTRAVLDIRVDSFGPPPSAVSLDVTTPSGSGVLGLRRDETRPGGWRGEMPYDGAGDYALSLRQGGALALDDRMRMDLPELGRVAVDWRLPGVARPSSLAEQMPDGTSILVAPYGGPGTTLPSQPFVLVHGKGATGPAQIGPFLQDHPILDGLNFDVFETVAPTPVQVGGAQPLISVLRPDGARGIWAGISDTPRGAVVPMPQTGGDPDASAVSRLIFYNALAWVADGLAPTDLRATHVDAAGNPLRQALAESATDRALDTGAPWALIREPPRDPVDTLNPRPDQSPWAPWLFLAALLGLLVDRLIGLHWRQRSLGDV